MTALAVTHIPHIDYKGLSPLLAPDLAGLPRVTLGRAP